MTDATALARWLKPYRFQSCREGFSFWHLKNKHNAQLGGIFAYCSLFKIKPQPMWKLIFPGSYRIFKSEDPLHVCIRCVPIWISILYACMPMCVPVYKPSIGMSSVQLRWWPPGHMEWSDRALESAGVTHAADLWWGPSYLSWQHSKLGLASRSVKTGLQHQGRR